MGTPEFRLAALLWFAAMAVLVAVVGWETDWGRHMTPEPEAPSARSAPLAVALLPDYALAVAAEARRETVERPAFVPTRRPPPPPPAQEPPKPKIQRGQFVLTGTAVVDKVAIAFLREATTGKSRAVRKGDSVNGLTVSSIAPDAIVLALGDETEWLPMKIAAGPRATIQPPQPGAPAAAPPAVPGQPPAAAAAAAAKPAPPDPEMQAQSLLERRRAARAAQAAAEAAARGGTSPAPGTPASQAPPAATGENSWSEVYRRMQQPRR